MNQPCQLLSAVLSGTRSLDTLSLDEWDILLRLAPFAGLLGRLAFDAEQEGLTGALPTIVQRHLIAARTTADRQQRAVAWEARKLDQALAVLDIPVVLLKGAAYGLANLPPARGRTFSDIDILVPKPQLGQVEAALRMHGWHSEKNSDYDERYYRRWMHELPPLKHIRRSSNLDVHHNLLPETARLKTHPDRIINDSKPLPGYQCLRVPCVHDLVLHSATHLFHEGEWTHGLRDLADLDQLFRHGGTHVDWWHDLSSRADELNLMSPLSMAMRYAHTILSTPIPTEVLANAFRLHGKMGWLWRDAMFLRGLKSFHPLCHLPGNGLASFILYVRSHALRMPMHLLLPHLGYKAWMSLHAENTTP